MIVPVMVNYDRIYEGSNLTTEMINGEKNDFTLFTSFKKLNRTPQDAVGHIYVKYLDPINLHDFLDKTVEGKLCHTNFDNTALSLTTLIMERQQSETPVTLNSLLSAWLLQE